MATFNDYLYYINQPYTHQLIKVEFLRPQDDTPYKTVIQEIVGNQGNYSEKRNNGIRRTVDLSFINYNGEFTPTIDGAIWVNRRFKLYLGIRFNGEDYFIPKGVYVMTNPNSNPFGSDNEVNISGLDKYALLDGTLNGRLDTTYFIASGTNIVTALATLITASGDSYPIVYSDAYYSVTIPYNFYIETGETYAEGIKKLAEYASANTYYNENGNFVFEQDISDLSKAPILSMSDTSDENLLFNGSFTYSFDKVVNSITVIGDNVNGIIAKFTYDNTDPTSDISIPNIGKIASDVIFDDIIDTVFYAEQRAIYEIRRQSRLFIDGGISCKKLYHIPVDNVIEVDSVIMGWNKKKLLIDSITMGLDVNGEMNITVKDAVEFI